MGKLEELMRASGGFASESMGRVQAAAPPAAKAAAVTDRLQGVVRSRSAMEIPVEKIHRDPNQPREEFDEDALQRLAASLKEKGQLQPIRVRWDEGQGVYRIVCGERRWRAARMAGLATISATVQEGEIAPDELLALQLVENALREDLRPIEQAKAYKALMASRGWSIRQLAAELRLDHSGVAKQLTMLELPEPVQASVDRGELTPTTAYEIAKVGDPAAAEEIGREAVAQKLTGAQVREAVQARRDPRPRPLRLEWKTRRGGVVQVTLPPGADRAAAAAELRDALKQIAAEGKQDPGSAEAA